jgi:predicted  nucleic acid-binding Zn-ribbon protein
MGTHQDEVSWLQQEILLLQESIPALHRQLLDNQDATDRLRQENCTIMSEIESLQKKCIEMELEPDGEASAAEEAMASDRAMTPDVDVKTGIEVSHSKVYGDHVSSDNSHLECKAVVEP